MAKRAEKPLETAGPVGPLHPITRLDGVIGQGSAKRILESALESGRVHHAWIFHGPVGIGKFTAAYAFGAMLLEPAQGAGSVRGLCESGSHPDLHVIRKELAAIHSDKKIREGKQTTIAKAVLEAFLLEPAIRTRVLSGDSPMGKVFIVDEAEMVDSVGQNFLLKLLEEPASGTAIILVTSNEDRLAATVRSRCQRVAFQALDDKGMDEWMKRAGVELDAKTAAWVRGFAAGSPGVARLAIGADLFRWEEMLGPLLATVDRGQCATELGGTMAKLIGERAEADVKANPDASKDGANKVWGRRMLGFVAEHYRGKLRGCGAAAARDPDDAATRRWLAAIDAVNAAEGHLAVNVNMGMLLENLAAQLAREPSLV